MVCTRKQNAQFFFLRNIRRGPAKPFKPLIEPLRLTVCSVETSRGSITNCVIPAGSQCNSRLRKRAMARLLADVRLLENGLQWGLSKWQHRILLVDDELYLNATSRLTSRRAFDVVSAARLGISLGASCHMRFRKHSDPRETSIKAELPSRFIYFLTGSARREWQRTIPPVKHQRWSETFRTLRRLRTVNPPPLR